MLYALTIRLLEVVFSWKVITYPKDSDGSKENKKEWCWRAELLGRQQIVVNKNPPN
jgi:hypothetical protein